MKNIRIILWGLTGLTTLFGCGVGSPDLDVTRTIEDTQGIQALTCEQLVGMAQQYASVGEDSQQQSEHLNLGASRTSLEMRASRAYGYAQRYNATADKRGC